MFDVQMATGLKRLSLYVTVRMLVLLQVDSTYKPSATSRPAGLTITHNISEASTSSVLIKWEELHETPPTPVFNNDKSENETKQPLATSFTDYPQTSSLSSSSVVTWVSLTAVSAGTDFEESRSAGGTRTESSSFAHTAQMSTIDMPTAARTDPSATRPHTQGFSSQATSSSFTAETSQTLALEQAGSGTTGVNESPATSQPELQCNISQTVWVRTVVLVKEDIQKNFSLKQELLSGLSSALQHALNLSSARARVESISGWSDVTVGYYVVSGSTVYTAWVVVEALTTYGSEKLLADLRHFAPCVQSVQLAAAPWWPHPAVSTHVRTVLRFVSPSDDITSCAFAQSMEHRLASVFVEAQSKVLNTSSRLSVQLVTVSRWPGSAVSLVYVVRCSDATINGTFSSSLLNQLTAEMVGYFLFFPPLIIAEPLEYHNLNTSASTRDFWVITVIQYVDNSSLKLGYQSFARVMEQRLAELFVFAGQRGARLRRAATVGGYTVQMVSVRRVPGLRNPAEMTYYVQLDGKPLAGTSAAKILNTVDSQTAALTLGYFVQVQAEPVVKSPPANLWLIPAVLVPICVVTIIVIIIAAVLCRKKRADFKSDALGRTKTSYRREASFYHQPVQGFDYAKQHLGQQGGEEEVLPVSQETKVLPLPIRDGLLSHQNGTGSKKTLSSEILRRLPSEDGSAVSTESGKLGSGRGSSVQRAIVREEAPRRSDPYETSTGSLQLVMKAPVTSHPATELNQDPAGLSGEVSSALKQKSDIERYRNKLRLKARQRGQSSLCTTQQPDISKASGFGQASSRCAQLINPANRSRQSLSSPGPSATEMDLLVMGERPGRGIRNSGYDTEPELIEETDIDHLMGLMGYSGALPLRGHSESSTLSSQPSIDEVRQQMHLLLDEAFTLASTGHSTGSCRPPSQPAASPSPGSECVTSAPGSISRPCGPLHWAPPYGLDLLPCSLPKPTFRFTQLPDMALQAPPVPPRTGNSLSASLRRSTSELEPKSVPSVPCVPVPRTALPGIPAEHSVAKYSGNPITAIYALPANRPGHSGYVSATPPTSYRSPSWMSYPPEPDDLPRQWAGTNQCHLETIC